MYACAPGFFIFFGCTSGVPSRKSKVFTLRQDDKLTQQILAEIYAEREEAEEIVEQLNKPVEMTSLIETVINDPPLDLIDDETDRELARLLRIKEIELLKQQELEYILILLILL